MSDDERDRTPNGGPQGRPDAPSLAARRFELDADLTPHEERAVIRALERYFAQESPHPHPWVLSGRIDATGFGALQVRRFAREPWHGQWVEFARKGVPPVNGRGDVR